MPMAALTTSLTLNPQYLPKGSDQHSAVTEEIEGLIRVHKGGHVERPQIVTCVTPAVTPDLNVTSKDVIVDNLTKAFARFYVPFTYQNLPLLVYFHGGGFCIGSSAWSCYHEFLAKLSAKLGCLIISVNYRLAPENPLPAAYEDGLKALIWVKNQILYKSEANEWWCKKCNFNSVFLAGDSAGANIAYNVATRLADYEVSAFRPLNFRGLVLIQPFFGGENRTASEKNMVHSAHSTLSLAASDTYWRLALPAGTSRDHLWCNPLAEGVEKLKAVRNLAVLVCISEVDILKDRNLEFCTALGRAGNKRVEYAVFKDVGHAFQILNKSRISESRKTEMMARIKTFMGL